MNAASVFVNTPRLSLREFQLVDWPEVLGWAGDQAVTEPMAVAAFDAAAAQAYVARMVAARSTRPRRRWEVAIVTRDGGGLIGACGLAIHGTAGTLGYALARECWGAGYAVEAATAMLTVAFERLALARVAATCRPGHTRSARVLVKLGFKRRRATWWERWWGPQLWHFELPRSAWAPGSLLHADGTGSGPTWPTLNDFAPTSTSGSTPTPPP